MSFKLNAIAGVVITNLIIFGLAACSSTTAPRVQETDSQWYKGSGAETQESSLNASLDDSTAMESAEPVVADSMIAEPRQEANVSETITPVIVVEDEPLVTGLGSQDIMAMLSTNYAVQVFAGNTIESVEKFKTTYDLADLITVKTDHNGKTVYVLVDVYISRADADEAAANLEVIIGSKPWVRSLAGLQEIIAQ